jgi:hypothetical protein
MANTEQDAVNWMLAEFQSLAKRFPEATHVMWRCEPEWRTEESGRGNLWLRLALFNAAGQVLLDHEKKECQPAYDPS